ncbi:hypothetical protein Tco_0955609 [Tanacetum coccineum]|uniref:Uncharacterized protein n=1 Tax=Tanacetum coccineum TaxID=301880 RepID=A0ABQ5E7Q1_9ASTR
MVSLLVSKVDRLECAYSVYPILPAIPNQSRIIWEVGYPVMSDKCGDRSVPTPEIEGVPLRAWENGTFNLICRKWGDVLFSDDSDTSNRLSKRIYIKSTHSQLMFATWMVSLKKITYAIRIRELCSWTPTFVRDDLDGDEEDSLSNKTIEEKEEEAHEKNDDESVAATFKDIGVAKVELDHLSIDGGIKDQPIDVASYDSDPFGLDSLINKKYNKGFDMKVSETPVYLLGFSPTPSHNQHDGPHDHAPVLLVGSESSHKIGDSNKVVGFSVLERLEETIKVALVLGLNMEGCETTLEALIANNRECLVDK